MSIVFRILEPEVAGGLGEGTILDRSSSPPTVLKLHYEFEGWLGDELLTSHPCFIVTANLRMSLEDYKGTGYSFDTLTITTSKQFDGRYSQVRLPEFVWLRIHGVPGQDDIGLSRKGSLVVNEDILNVMKRHRLENCLVRAKPFSASTGK